MKLTRKLILISIAFILLISCTHDDNQTIKEVLDPNPKPVKYISDRTSNLNVVYFIPKDKDTLTNYQKRLSGIMKHTQDWFANEMNSYGYGKKTFGLLVDEDDSQRVQIIVIRGQLNSSAYGYNTNGAASTAEIQDYFNKNISESTSDHTVIFMPSFEGDHGWDAGGVPFYGIGKWCYVLDYKYFDMDTWRDGTQEGSSNWIGGTIHEIAHALNLPHNQHKVNDGWTSMMSWGNHEYNATPYKVHLTRASAAILNNNQVFNSQEGSYFYDEIPSNEIKSLKIYSDKTNLYINTKFNTSSPVNAVIAFNDPKLSDTDSNYNAITWTTTNIENDSISLTMPLTDINTEYKQHPFELRLQFLHINGMVSQETFKYEFVNDKPEIDINVFEVSEIDKSAWTIENVSSEEASGEGSDNGLAIHAIDGNTGTFWHSQWSTSQPNYPHYITINFNTDQLINGFTFLHRSDKYNGRPKDISIEVSSDGLTFKKLGDFILSDFSLKQIVELVNPTKANFIKITIQNGYDDERGEDVFFTFIRELGIY